MSSRNPRRLISALKKSRQYRDLQRRAARRLHLEQLEDRRLMALGPRLVAILPNSGVLLSDGDVRNVAPKDLTLRFGEGQAIDPATIAAGIRITRSGFDDTFGDANDVVITPGFIGLGDTSREVVMRFAETLPDDAYRIEIFGAGATPLRDVAGNPFNDGNNFQLNFQLDLGAKVVAVVPQPVTRVTDPTTGVVTRTQARDKIIVYFNNDDLLPASAQNPAFYKLIATRNTLQPVDDVVFLPSSVAYDPATDSVTLTFSGPIDQLLPPTASDPDPARSFRLRIGTDESIVPQSTAQSLVADPGSSFGTANDIPASLQTGVPFHVTERISAQPYDLTWPGANVELGHRHIEVEDHLQNGPDNQDGITTVFYNFRSDIGEIPDGIGGFQPAFNLITEAQKQRAREVFDLIGRYAGIQFIETVNQGITVATGDMRAVGNTVTTGAGHPLGIADPPIDPTNPNAPTDPTGRFTRVILDNAEVWSDLYGGNWMREAMQQIGRALGLGYSFDLPPLTINGNDPALQFTSPPAEPVFPGDHDIVHYQHLYRPESKDIDMYRFTLDKTGVLRIETFAERLADSSSLDTLLRLYQVGIDGRPVLIAQNDDYFSKDSYIELTLGAGTYFLGVSSKGNDQYDPTIVDTGMNGTTQGLYQLKLDFRPAATTSIVDATGTPFDGDSDGNPGGVYNFWFRAAAPRGAEPAGAARTIFVDKEAPAGGNGSLASPYNNLATALANARSSVGGKDVGDIVQIIGNDGADNNPLTLNDNLAYQIGFNVAGQPLPDGSALAVPRNVTVMIDAGAIFQLRRGQIVAGSTSPAVASDRSGGALQVLGTPSGRVVSGVATQNVFFTSYNEQGPNSIGLDTNPLTTTPAPGDWGGIYFKSDLDRADGRFLYEEVGVFLNYVNNADIRWGGGQVVVDSVSQVVTPIQMIDTRPTVTYNTITRSADAAMSANPDSFEETNFQAPKYFRSFNTAWNLDYDRVGPDIHGNLILNNTTNGLFIRTRTPAGNQLEELTVAGRLDDTDIVHVIQENLVVRGTPSGGTLETIPPPIILVVMGQTTGGNLQAGDVVEYRMTYVDLLGNEGVASDASLPITITASDAAVQMNNLPVPTGEFVARRLYRRLLNVPGSEYEFVGQVPASRTSFVDTAPRNGIATQNNDRMMVAATQVPVPQFVNFTATEIPGGGAGFSAGTQLQYQFSYLDSQRRETVRSGVQSHTVTTNDRNVQIAGIPPVAGNLSIVRIYRAVGAGPFVAILELPADFATVIIDSPALPPAGGLQAVAPGAPTPFMPRPRPDASLVIDPSLVVKSEGARVEVGVGATLLAEGLDGLEIIFTSLSDDRYGAGGTFDTRSDNNQPVPKTPAPGDWGGIYFWADSRGSIDQSVIAYGGGLSRVEGNFSGFNPIEIHQADVRVANSKFEFNGGGAGGQGPLDRFGRGFNQPGNIFIRGAQPVVVDNIAHNNLGPLVNVNVNALTSETVVDWGRSRGLVDRVIGHFDNNGPLIHGNRLVANTLNGMIVRGGTVTTEVVMDDTDIVHAIFDAITVTDFHTYGGLRLESLPTESLVLKFSGPTAGIVATGRPLEIDDRIGGSIQVVGQPGFPVILTSLGDDTASAGFTPSGEPQGDTNGDGPSGGGSGNPTFPPATGELQVTYNTNGMQLVNAMIHRTLPQGVTISGATYTGANIAAGTYINGDEVALEIAPRGIILSSGDVNLPVSNTTGFFSANNNTPGDADLSALIGNRPTNDAAILTITIDVDPTSNIRSGAFDFQFGSDEYNEFVGSQFNDVLGGFINGGASTNFIRDFQGNLVSINSALFDIDNLQDILDIEYDGLTSGLTATFPLQPGTNVLKIAIADATDRLLDSGVLITDLRFSSRDVGSGGVGRRPLPGEWLGVLVDRFANDRNVQDVVEFESPQGVAPGANSVPENAQFIGGLGPFEKGGDENLRLGYTIHGLLNAVNDVDVYSFQAKSGTEVWMDIDRTSHALDAVLELIDDNGNVLARSDNSPAESAGAESLFGQALRMHKTPPFEGRDVYTTNPRDPGMRVILPGPANTTNTYHVRVRSSSPNLNNVSGGLTLGAYQLQLRLREEDEVSGTAIVFSDIRYAVNGIRVLGQPTHSPLAGEHRETAGANDQFGQAQQLGNLLNSDRGTLAVAGELASRTDVDWYRFTINYDAIQRVFETEEFPSPERWFSTLFDIDYADGFARPNTIINIYDSTGRLVLSSRDSNIGDDRPRPLSGADVSDLNRGSSGAADPFIGMTEMPEGVYFLAISSDAVMPAEMQQYFSATPINPLFRLEPINSVRRIVEDHLDYNGGSTAEPPQVPIFIDGNSEIPYHLGDLVLFVVQENFSGPEISNLRTIDPFTGALETLVGTIPFDVGDIDFRSDFNFLYSYTLDSDDVVEGPQDSESGNFLQIDTGNAAITNLGDDGIVTYELDAAGNPVVAHLFNNNRIGWGIQFDALSFGDVYRDGLLNSEILLAVGHRGELDVNPNLNPYIPRRENVLYLMNTNNGTPRVTGAPARVTGQGTNVFEMGEILTAPRLFVVEATAAPLTGQTDAQRLIKDGDIISVDDNQGVTTFEFDSGPEVLQDVDPSNQRFVDDGYFFTLDPDTNVRDGDEWIFQFETGIGLNVIANSPFFIDGSTVSITGAPGTSGNSNTLSFEFSQDGTLNNPTSFLVDVRGNLPPAGVAGRLVQVINAQTSAANWPVTASQAGGRVVLRNNTNVELSNDLSGRVVLHGSSGKAPVLQAVAGNQIVDGTFFDLTVYSTLNSQITFRFEFDSNNTLTAPSAGVTVVRIPYTAADSSAQIASAMFSAMNTAPAAPVVQPQLSTDRVVANGAKVGSGATFGFNQQTSPIVDLTTVQPFQIIKVEEDFIEFDPVNPLNPQTIAFAVTNIINQPTVPFSVSADFDRINFPPIVSTVPKKGPVFEMDVTGMQGRWVKVIGSETGISPTNERIILEADDTTADIATKIANAVNAALTSTSGIVATANTSLLGAFVQLNFGTFIVNAPFSVLGQGPGGRVTGLANIRGTLVNDPVDQGGLLFAVSDQGGLYRVQIDSLANITIDPNAIIPKTSQVTTTYIASSEHDLRGIPFQGLTSGPVQVEGGRYQNLLFGIDNNGRVYAFDTQGRLQPVFANGATFVDTGITNARGLAFSNLEDSLWHFTPRNSSSERSFDAGHGLLTPYDNSRTPDIGGVSVHYGRGNASNYFSPGGNHGSIVSNEFSLEGYTPQDQPVLYFNYFANTANNNADLLDPAPPFPMRDAFRVFIAGDDGVWRLLGTNNSERVAGSFFDEYDYNPAVQEIFDSPSGWRQVRVDLAQWAGQKNLRLRFDFSTAGSMNLGDTFTTGDELRAVRGSQIQDGDTIQIDGNTFEFEMDYALNFPSAPAINDGETLTLHAGPFGAIQTLQEGIPTLQNERQQLRLHGAVTGGTFTLTVRNPATGDPFTTGPIPFNASPAQIQAALAGLPFIGFADVNVTGPSNLTLGPMTIEFTGPNLGNTDISQITVDSSQLVGSYSQTFEFNKTGGVGAGNTAIDILDTMSAADVASLVAAAVRRDILSIGVHQINDNQVQFDGSTGLDIAASSAVRRVSHGFTIQVAAIPADGQRFTINDGRHGVQTFEFDTNGVVSPGNFRVDLVGVTNTTQAAQRIFQSINTNLPDAVPRYTTGAKVNLLSVLPATDVLPHGGLNLSQAPTLRRIAPGFRLEFVTVPLDGATITINDGQNPSRTFEFDRGGGTAPGNTPINIINVTTAAGAAAAARAAIAAALPAAAPRIVDGIHLHLLGAVTVSHTAGLAITQTRNPSSVGVLPGHEAISVHRGMNREEVAAAVNAVFEPFQYNAAIVAVAGSSLSDGQSFTINNGVTAPVTFEFETGFIVNIPTGGGNPLALSHVDDGDTITLSVPAGGRAVTRTVQIGGPTQNEIHELELNGLVTGGTFTLSVLGGAPIVLPFDATAAQIQSALDAQIGAGNAFVSGSLAAGAEPIRIEFAGVFARQNVVSSVANGAGLAGQFDLIYEFDKPGTPLPAAGRIRVDITDNFSQLAVAQALQTAVQNTPLATRQAFGLDRWNGRVLSGARVQLGGDQGMTIAFSNPAFSSVGTPGVQDGRVAVHIAPSTNFRASDVAAAIATAINGSPLAVATTATSNPLGGPDQRRVELSGRDNITLAAGGTGLTLERNLLENGALADVVKQHRDLIRVIAHDVTDRGPLGAATGLEGDIFGAFNSNLRGQANNFEGIYFDDIIIGFAERGEMATGAGTNTTFVSNPLADPLNVANGPYQLEIRRGTDFAVPGPGGSLALVRSIDTNDRMVTGEFSLVAPPGASLRDGQTFTLSDGVNSVTFEFNDLSLFSNAIVQGHARIDFRSFWTDDQIARAIRDVINSSEVQAVLNVQAALSDGALVGQPSTDNVLNLYGAVTFHLEGDEAREINDTIAQAVPASLTLSRYTANGTIGDNPVLSTDRVTQPLDVDLFSINLVAGQRIHVSVDAVALDSQLDPVLRIFDAAGVQVPGMISFNNPSPGKQSRNDAYLNFVAPATGTYYIGVSGEGNAAYNPLTGTGVVAGDMGHYVLNITSGFIPGPGPDLNAVSPGEGTPIAIQRDLNEYAGQAIPIDYARASVTYDGLIGDNATKAPGRDRDVFVVDLEVGETIRVNVDAQSIGSPLDPVIRIFNGLGAEIRFADNAPAPGKTGAPRDAFLQFTVTPFDLPGPFYIAISGAGNDAYDVLSPTAGDADGSSGHYRVTFTRTGFGISEEPMIVANDEFGDKNLFRDQGQILLIGNRISNSADWGILVDAGARTPADGNTPHQGPVRNLRELNTQQLVPGVVIINNIIFDNGDGGIRFSGDPTGDAPVPFGRIVNNTLFGGGGTLASSGLTDVGIRVDERAGPTLLNNVIANFTQGISVDASSLPNTVLGGMLYQGNQNNSNAGLGDFPITLVNTDPLFVNFANRNFYLKAQSPAIDSSIDSLLDRPALVTVRNPLGIPVSPILAPDRDAAGQKRVDDPDVETPSGIGENVTKDRGALDRVDFTGPTSRIINPADNDSLGVDLDPTNTVVVLKNQVLTNFSIQLIDSFDPNAPLEGSGIDDLSVFSSSVVIEEIIGTNVRVLVQGVDYSFSYDATNNLIRLNPLGGLWPLSRTYRITLDNDPIGDPLPNNGIRDLAGNVLLPNQLNGTHIYTIFLGSANDWGDAPDPLVNVPGKYPTLSANNGASHQFVGGFHLGATNTADPDGQPSAAADADTSDDGVTFGELTANGLAQSTVTVNASAPAKLDAWFDLNRDGDWDDAGEKVIDGFSMVAGDNVISFILPQGPKGTTFARFRMSSAGVASPTGPADDGEVEDYQITLVGPPFQNPDNNLDVNDDGFVSAIDALLVFNAYNRFLILGGSGNMALPHPQLATSAPPFIDVDGDGTSAPIDALAVINFLNIPPANPEGEGEGPGFTAFAADRSGVPPALVVSPNVIIQERTIGDGQDDETSRLDEQLFADEQFVAELTLATTTRSRDELDDEEPVSRNKRQWDLALAEWDAEHDLDLISRRIRKR